MSDKNNQADDMDRYPTITLNPTPDATFRDLLPDSFTKKDKRGMLRNDTSLPKDAGSAKSKGNT